MITANGHDRSRWARCALLSSALAALAAACSDSESNALHGDAGSNPDGADAAFTEPDAHEEDGGSDATTDGDSALDASADGARPDDGATARPCTSEGWCHTVVPDGQSFNDVWGDGSGTVWVVSQQGKIFRWDGAAWVESTEVKAPHPLEGYPPIVVPLSSIWGSSPTDLWVSGSANAPLLHGTGPSPSAITWTKVSLPTAAPVLSLWGTSATDVWAITSNQVLHYTGPPSQEDADAGATGWTVLPAVLSSGLKKIWGTGPNDIWIGGSTAGASGTMVLFRGHPSGAGEYLFSDMPRSTDKITSFTGGGAFSRTSVYLLGAINNSAANQGFYLGNSADDGATFTWTWQSFKSGRAPSYDAWGTGADDFWLVGALGRVRHWDGVDWHVAALALDDVLPVTATLNAVWGSGPNDVWAVGNEIALHKIAP